MISPSFDRSRTDESTGPESCSLIAEVFKLTPSWDLGTSLYSDPRETRTPAYEFGPKGNGGGIG